MSFKISGGITVRIFTFNGKSLRLAFQIEAVIVNYCKNQISGNILLPLHTTPHYLTTLL